VAKVFGVRAGSSGMPGDCRDSRPRPRKFFAPVPVASSLLPTETVLKIEAIRYPAGAFGCLRLTLRDGPMTDTRLTWGFIAIALFPPISVRAGPVSFRNDVMAVLSRAGCNQGACHGNQNGKNGFKLSLRGQDPAFDFNVLTRDTLGRRTDCLHPEDSLILAKATSRVPHEGGKRFDRDSLEYRLLYRWIAEGMRPDPANSPMLRKLEVTPSQQVLIEPADRVPLRVRAIFSDGQVRDVTRLCVFETSNLVVRVDAEGVAQRQSMGETTILVRYLDRQAAVQLAFVPARPGFVWSNPPEANYIDHHIFAKLRSLHMAPSPQASDSVFLRRIYLDVLGVLPKPDETRRFLADTRSDKRVRLIDALLERPEFADFWALKWADLLHCEEKALDAKGVRVFHDWIRRSIADGKPLNEMARELIAGRGSTYSEPAANWYRSLRDPQARAEAAAEVFLGIRMQCARCHNHPFDRWTQTDYHSFAAFFCRVQYRIVENNRRDNLDKHEFNGEQIVWMDRSGEITHPSSGEVLRPMFLGSDTPALAPNSDRLLVLADWIADPKNPFFARAQVNRVWHHLFGRGIVEPNDDFRASNPPVNAPLLDNLAEDFVAHRFDLRSLLRTILNSRTYQLSAVPNETNVDDEANFARAQVRPLQAEQLLDALGQVMGVAPRFPDQPSGTRAGQLPGVSVNRGKRRQASDGERFLTSFGKPIRLLSCECERSDDTTLYQAFQLITGPLLNQMLRDADNRIGHLLASGRSDAEILEEFYLAALCRPPSATERQTALAMLSRAKDRRAALEDFAWGLVNAKEFLLRR
jgi:hypothetical protein